MRKIAFKLNPLTSTISTSDFRNPTKEDILRGRATSVLLELAEIGNKTCLCDYEIFNKKPMFYSAVSFMPSQIILISHFDLKSILGDFHDIMLQMKQQARPFPPEKRIRKQFIEMQKWELFKHKTVMNTLINYKNDRK